MYNISMVPLSVSFLGRNRSPRRYVRLYMSFCHVNILFDDAPADPTLGTSFYTCFIPVDNIHSYLPPHFVVNSTLDCHPLFPYISDAYRSSSVDRYSRLSDRYGRSRSTTFCRSMRAIENAHKCYGKHLY